MIFHPIFSLILNYSYIENAKISALSELCHAFSTTRIASFEWGSVLDERNQICTSCAFCYANDTTGTFVEASTIWVMEDLSLRTRKVGLLFLKRSDSWVFIVLFEPIIIDPVSYSEGWPKFRCYLTNFKSSSYDEDKLHLPDLMNYIKTYVIGRGIQGVQLLLSDVFLGWEDYFAQMENDSSRV